MLISPDVIDILDPMSDLVSAGEVDGQSAFALWRDGAVRLLDDRLAEKAQRELPLEGDVCVLAASGLDLVILASADGLVIAGKEVVTVPGLPADATALLGGRPVVAVPEGESHRLLLLDPATGAILDDQAIDADDARAFLHPHPAEDTAILELAMGQDGVLGFRVDVEGTRLHLTEILTGDDPVFAGFSPSGSRLLVTPHSDPQTIRVLSWPDLKEISRLDASAVDAEYGFGLAGCWINDERVAVYATEDALIVADENFDSPERIVLPIDFGDDGEIEKLTYLGSENIAVGAWTPSGRLTLVVHLIEK
ncbi:hypothetical protein [Mycolicibacterium mageritense]|uniref:WD40 repeat domain-containing protein n=1 Tax=Mycolicibacterium mageritense TaxID=53462 RepID=A0AAI8TSW0_MYCME|nr:hypothetical protein [Mycolicibacterium mageritense]TXI59591.1 MAG: hypothetical protein E6Q55_21260 [Mycolicibacterium mageritense]BDY27801.1 hypothetical protein hbim_01730 [Mycolicibacterium mageritense]